MEGQRQDGHLFGYPVVVRVHEAEIPLPFLPFKAMESEGAIDFVRLIAAVSDAEEKRKQQEPDAQPVDAPYLAHGLVLR